jgi:hypothetical protein
MDLQISKVRTSFAIATWYTDGDGRGYFEEVGEFHAAAARAGMRKHCVEVRVPVSCPTWRDAVLLKPEVALTVYRKLGVGEGGRSILFLDADARIQTRFSGRELPRGGDVGWRVRDGEDLSGTLWLPKRNAITLQWLIEWARLCEEARPRRPPHHKVWGDQQLMRRALTTVDARHMDLPQRFCFVDKFDGQSGADTVIYHTQASRRRRGR